MKNNFLIILLLTIFCSGCKPQKFASNYESEDTFVIKTVLNEQDSRTYGMPTGTKISVFSDRDTTTNTEISIIVPISGNSAFNKAVRDTILTLKNAFLDSATKTEMSNYFEVSPESTYETNKIISIRFRIYEAHADAAHGGAYYFSYNWDVPRKKLIAFDDYFLIRSDEDEIDIIDLIKASFGKEGENFGNLRDTDFNIEADAVSFNPGQIGSYVQGLYKARIEKEKIGKFTVPLYR